MLPIIHDRLISLSIQKDTEPMLNSKFHSQYKNLVTKDKPSFVSQIDLSIQVLRVIAQIRISGTPRFLNGSYVGFDKITPCGLCSTEQDIPEDLYHVVQVCPHFKGIQNSPDFLKLNFPNNRISFANAFGVANKERSFLIHNVIAKLFKLRNYLIELTME